MKYVQRRANRYEFRFPLPDDLAGKPVPDGRPDSIAKLVNTSAGRFKTEIVSSLQTNDGRTADRKALACIAEADALVDAARLFVRDGPAAAISAEQIHALSLEHEIDLLRRDDALRRRGIGLELGREALEPDGRGMTSDDASLYSFTIGFLDRDLRSQAAQMRASDEIAARAEALLEHGGVNLTTDDPARRGAIWK